MLNKIFMGTIIALLVAGGIGYVVHQRRVQRLETRIEQLQGEKLALEIEKKVQAATIKHLETTKRVQKRVEHEKQTVQEVVNTGDLGRIRGLYDKYRVRPAAP